MEQLFGTPYDGEYKETESRGEKKNNDLESIYSEYITEFYPVKGKTDRKLPAVTVAVSTSLEAAIRAADEHAVSVGGRTELLRREAPWRDQPASEGQKLHVATILGLRKASPAGKLRIQSFLLTLRRGKASDIQTKEFNRRKTEEDRRERKWGRGTD